MTVIFTHVDDVINSLVCYFFLTSQQLYMHKTAGLLKINTRHKGVN